MEIETAQSAVSLLCVTLAALQASRWHFVSSFVLFMLRDHMLLQGGFLY